MTPKALAQAIADGKKLSHNTWEEGEYIYWAGDGLWKSGISLYLDMEQSENYELYKEPPKLVTWYLPKVIWYKGNRAPYFYTGMAWKCKEECIDHFGDKLKVLEWEEREFPATYEECE